MCNSSDEQTSILQPRRIVLMQEQSHTLMGMSLITQNQWVNHYLALVRTLMGMAIFHEHEAREQKNGDETGVS